MSSPSRNVDGLLTPGNFIRAIRESGYVSLSTALAELIDNSIQAGAPAVDITIDRNGAGDLPRITVTDDGGGMTEDELSACLRFGGSSRFNSRNSFGRFGMGLPAASLSRTRQVEVTAWRKDTPAQSVGLDVYAVVGGGTVTLEPHPGVRVTSESGCRVV